MSETTASASLRFWVLPEDPQITRALKRIGILNAKGHEAFYNCVVFPLYSEKGSIVNLYGRHIDLAFDADGAGHRATQTVSKQLKEKGIDAYPR